MMKKISLIIVLMCVAFISKAQDVVKWEIQCKKIAANTYEMHFTPKMQDSWHIYSLKVSGGMSIPTSFSFEKNPLATLTGGVKEIGMQKDFVQKIKLKKDTVTILKGSITYGACNDEQCLPPQTVEFMCETHPAVDDNVSPGGGNRSINAREQKNKLEIGDYAPNLVHIQKWIKGSPVTAFEKGKVYLVDITLTGCPGCVRIIPQLKEIARKYRGKVEVIAVYVTGNTKPESLEKFVERAGLNYTVAMDMPDYATNEEWGVQGWPSCFIVNQQGRIVSYGHSEKELESVLKTGGISDDVKNEMETSQNDRYNTILGFNKRMTEVFKNEGYAGKLRLLDSMLIHVNDEMKYDVRDMGLTMSKYEALLHLNDSVAADKCLKEQMENTPEGSWYYLVAKFNNYVPRSAGDHLLPFNYQRFLEICDYAANEMNSSFRFITRYFQAEIMYRYDPDRNKETALEVLDKAGNEDPDRYGDFMKMREKIEQLDKQHKKANDDWEKLEKLLILNMQEAEKIREKEGYAAYILYKERLMRRILAGAEEFWCKYMVDQRERRFAAFNIYTQAHRYNLIRWVDTTEVTKELADKINTRCKQRQEDYKRGQEQGKEIATGPSLFRMFPRDIKAETEWRNKRDEMARREMQWAASVEYKEKVAWELFVSDWGQVYSLWNELPARDERPEITVSGVEDDYWKLLAIHYWEASWRRFIEHVDKYACLPGIADRALDFLGATAGTHHTKELVNSYWKYILDTYGDPMQPLVGKTGIDALVKQAQVQFEADKTVAGEQAFALEPFIALDGREVNLASLRGKVVLVDFWATWCKPCIVSMPEFKAIYDKYHDKGLEVIGISLDNQGMEAQVKQVVKKQGLPWPQRFTGRGMDDPIAKLFRISALPTVWLLDKNGKIVGQNEQGERLEQMITKYLE
jgi:thiol-disulfide isomerase/thioredoxin